GTYKAYSYNHDGGLFSQIEECDIAVETPDAAVNATYTVTGDLTSICITAENHENTSIGSMYLTTSISDNDGNLVEMYDESFDLGPLQNATYEYEMETPEFNAFYVAETVLSINYSTVLDSTNFVIETEGSNEAEKAVILSIESPQVFEYGEDVRINLTVRSFKDALPVTLEVPEFDYSTTEYVTGEEVVQVVLPGQEPDDYITSVYLYGSDSATYDADIITFTVQAEGTGFLSIETDECLFMAGETITAPLVFTDAGLNDLDGEIFVQMRTPEHEVLDATVTGNTGNYQFSFTPPVNGTYIVTAEAHKDGYYIYGDQATLISGEMSPLEMTVGADEKSLYANITANGLPVGANVTVTTNGTEVVRTAVSGIATFPKEDNYCLTATMLFFTPAEFSHILPEVEFHLEDNRTIAGQNILFNASESHDSDGWVVEYIWDFGDDHNETTTSGYTLHSYNTSGCYVANLTVVDNDGLNSSIVKEITVTDTIIPNFRLSEQSIYVNYTGDVFVQAKDLDEISWLRAVIEFNPDIVQAVEVIEEEDVALTSHIGEGVIIVEANATAPLSGSANIASITFKGLQEGSSAINISATCKDTADHQVEPVVSGSIISVLYGEPLVVDFTVNATSGTAPLAVQFTDTSTGAPTVWFWTFGDSSISTEQHPVHTYTTAGTYPVSLIATNTDGSNTTTKADFIAVAEPPAYEFVKSWGSEGSSDVETFSYPTGIAVDAVGNVYVADFLNHCIRIFDSSGTFIATWGSYGSGNDQFNRPTGIAVDAAGNVYVADYYNNRIQKFNASGSFLTTWGSEGSGNGQFNKPWGVAVDAAGDVYVADYYNNRIQKFDNSGTFLMAWGTTGSGNGQFNGPICLAVDAAGNIYVSDDYNNRIQIFDSSGNFLTTWGSK
ncbi:MAG: PKD domain-containing protein, partial [Eubacteriales bacterium]|nr:PKD domain-containing protein [Eubacteriales bacterium]